MSGEAFQEFTQPGEGQNYGSPMAKSLSQPLFGAQFHNSMILEFHIQIISSKHQSSRGTAQAGAVSQAQL